MNYLILKMAM